MVASLDAPVEVIAVADVPHADAVGPARDLLAPRTRSFVAVPQVIEAVLERHADRIEAVVALAAPRARSSADGLPIRDEARGGMGGRVADDVGIVGELGPRVVARQFGEMAEERRGVIGCVGLVATSPRAAPRAAGVERQG